MRIIGGKYRSRVLAEFAGEGVRPTLDRAREALFNILARKVSGARVLDLFAGSGALGLESLSRGASEVVFNDISKESLAILKKNLTALKVEIGKEVNVKNYDYAVCLNAVSGKFDLIFLDPPYRLDCGKKALEEIVKNALLSDDGVIVYERDFPFEESVEGLEKFDERRYGKAWLTFFRKGGNEK